MNTKSLLASVMMLAFALIQCPAQQPAAASTDKITVNMLGQVNYPARIVLPKGSAMLDALATVGGFTKTGNPAKCLLIHKTTGEKPDSVKIDLRSILSGAARDILLKDGDTVVVGEVIF